MTRDLLDFLYYVHRWTFCAFVAIAMIGHMLHP